MKIFNLPDLGEGLPDAEIHQWHVKVGDVVKLDQLLVSVETAKAVVDVPSPQAGKIAKLYGKEGDVIATHAPLLAFEDANAAPAKAPDKGTVAGSIEVGNTVIVESAMGIVPQRQRDSSFHAKALPAVRNMARQLGVDLDKLTASGANGQITIDDVKRAASGSAPASTAKAEAPEGYEGLRGVRRTMANAMVQSHREVVPVTIVDDADLHAWEGKQDITARIVRALCAGCKAEPALNAWFDTASMSRKLHKQIDIGLALDSPDGLFVPVIRNAAKMTPKKLRDTIDRFKKQVGDRSIPPEELRDSTIMLSNFGMLAGRYATPIIVPPLVAILGCGRLHEAIVAVKGKPQAHRVLPLSLTFDHRAITGGEATRFLATVIADLAKEK